MIFSNIFLRGSFPVILQPMDIKEEILLSEDEAG
jgi:hypothetical protein